MEKISHRYRDRIMKMLSRSRGDSHVSESNVYQRGNAELLPSIDGIIEENLLAGSEIRHLDRLMDLLESSKAGEPCLLLVEHYSNFDLPAFQYLLRKSGPDGAKAAEAIVAIAGIKLNESNPVVLAFTEAYSRLVVYPSRSMEIIKRNLKDPKELVAEVMRSTTVNRAAMKALAELKKQGHMILVFPSGTRFRPWDPSSKHGLREIDSYIRSFSKMCLVSVNGNLLRINPEGEMEEDLICQDRMVFDVGPVTDCVAFREAVKHEHRMREDKKQAVADTIMERLDAMHNEVEKDRL